MLVGQFSEPSKYLDLEELKMKLHANGPYSSNLSVKKAKEIDAGRYNASSFGSGRARGRPEL